MGLPAIVARAFPGNREEANRAGITPRIRVGTIDHSTAPICAARAKKDGAAPFFSQAPWRATRQTTRLSAPEPVPVLHPLAAVVGTAPLTQLEELLAD